MKLPMEERRRILEQQADELAAAGYYERLVKEGYFEPLKETEDPLINLLFHWLCRLGDEDEPKLFGAMKLASVLKRANYVEIEPDAELPKLYDAENDSYFNLPSWCIEAYKKAGWVKKKDGGRK